MASHTKGEILHIVEFCLFVTTEIAFVAGLITQVFILAVIAVDWGRGRRLSTADQVIVSIMISRILLHSVIQMNMFWTHFCAVCSFISSMILRMIFFSTMYSTTWLSTLLCVVFYFKISIFRNVLFLWLKRLFSKCILHFIIAVLLISAGQTSAIYLVTFLTEKNYFSFNLTHGYRQQPSDVVFSMYLVNMLAPLVIILLSSLFLIIYLHLHIRHMRGSRKVTTSMDAYNRIIKYTASTIFTCGLCFTISGLAEKFYDVFGFVLVSFPWTISGTLHSVLLIFMTPKLKTPIYRLFKYFSNYGINREEPRDLITTIAT
ncbi:taste receptor type 2 member 13-like [Engystomops pustulosus]|uniref:taste receptor type 2 member 13-like n=1 Tax=Engystomops pustulosus TaxID=76066 RepID=UPI003AFAEDB3